jgi:class 3 adenylate cyclase/AmiR/NasT family two-component response regulator
MARILIVDNEVSSRDLLRLHLETAGHQVFAAEDAIAGLRLAVSMRPDLVLCGAAKPGLDVPAAVAAIRANPGITQTPIVILAQNGDADSVRQAMEHGADDYVTQPLAREELLRVVDFRLRRNEALRDFSANIAAIPTPSVAPSGEVDPVALQALRSTSGVTSTAMFTARSAGYVDPVAASPQEARYGTVLFSDIRSFSTLAEALTTMEVAEVLNAYFVRACEPILQQGGWIVKLLGDGVLALFEPGSHREDHAERALRAALFHVIVAQRFNQWLSRRFPDRALPDFAVGIGVHTGDAVVVKVNTGAGVDITIIGDTVNVASRLEEQTKKLGASVVTSIDTLMRAGSRFIPGKRGSLLVRGRSSPVEITEIVGLRPRQNADMRSLHTYETIKEAISKNAAIIMRVRDQVLAEPHRFRTPGQFAPLRPADSPIKIPGYRLLRRLGQGGLSRAFLAEYEPTGTSRVLKVLNISEGGFDLLQRFLQEYDLISQIRHPNVAEIFGHGQTDTHAYIVMEYFPGGDLRQRIREQLPPRVALDSIRQVAEALVEVHARGIVHRDLKPDTLMLREDGTLVLADFGIAKNVAAAYNHTRHGEGLGTPYYMSPEQALGKRVDHRSDLYSLGVLFYEMLTGERPFVGEDAPQVAQKHIHAPVPTLPDSLAEYQGLIDKLLAKLPEDRFRTAEIALDSIRAHIGLLTIQLPPPPAERPQA